MLLVVQCVGLVVVLSPELPPLLPPPDGFDGLLLDELPPLEGLLFEGLLFDELLLPLGFLFPVEEFT